MPDNLRAGVTRAHRYEPELNRTYAEMAAHYGGAVIPARPNKPRDKAKAEFGVLVAERWILARLRQRAFFSLAEANAAIRERLAWLNNRPFKKLPGSRQSMFEELDRPALRPLPAPRYEFATWKMAKVNIDYHVEVDRHWYTVPHQLVGTASTSDSARTRSRSSTGAAGWPATAAAEPRRLHHVEAHMPEGHRAHREWTPGGSSPGRRGRARPPPARHRHHGRRPHPEQGFRSCLGIMRLAALPDGRLEAAAAAPWPRALPYRSVESILARPRRPTPARRRRRPPRPIRATTSNCAAPATTSNPGGACPCCQPHPRQAPRSRSAAWPARSPSSSSAPTTRLAFEERLGLLVDREAQDRENRRLARHLKAARLRSARLIEDLDFRHPRGLDRAPLLGLAEAAGSRPTATSSSPAPPAWARPSSPARSPRPPSAGAHRALLARAAPARRPAPRTCRRPAAAAAGHWARVDVLVLDDLAGPAALAAGRRPARGHRGPHQRRSTIVTSQLPVRTWHEALGEPTLADAIRDRLLTPRPASSSAASRCAGPP